MVFNFKKKPIEQPQAISTQDLGFNESIPIGERVMETAQNVSNAIYNPQPMPPQPPRQQAIPQIKQAVEQPTSDNDDMLNNILVDLDARLSHIESWLFRRTK